MKKKKTYLAPLTTVTSVELESPICSGSAIIENDKAMGIEAQTTNTAFDAGSENSGAEWTYTVSGASTQSDF